ncbi:MAG: cobalamin B12-binding domain-containing protein [Desulfatibacillaceae bacterium]
MELYEKLKALLADWEENGVPPRHTVEDVGQQLIRWKQDRGVAGVWKTPPTMVTATIDDGMGFGLFLIQMFGEIAGLEIHPLGLMRKKARIIEAVQKQRPDILGLTVLQFTSEEDLVEIGGNLPENTALVVGGPVFKGNPELTSRANVAFVARDVGAFLRWLLATWPPDGNGASAEDG